MLQLMQSIQIAAMSLLKNRLRTALAVLGMAVGVGSVVLLISIASGVRAEVLSQVESLASDCAFVLPGKPAQAGVPNPMALMGISTLTPGDVSAVAGTPGVAEAFPVMFVAGSIDQDGRTISAFVVAADAHVQRLHPGKMAAGIFYGHGETRARTAVVGNAVARELSPHGSALGSTVVVRSTPFRVVGVLAPEPTTMVMPGGFDQVVYLPYGVARPLFPGGQISRIVFRVGAGPDPSQSVKRVESVLRRQHEGRDDFAVLTQQSIMGAMFRLSTVITALLAGIAGISIAVAAIGITNIMVATVTERSREIGIRKAFGAGQRAIFAQFLAEAALIAGLGGLLGILLAVSVNALISSATPLRPVATAGTILLAFATCFLVGIVSGVLPAVRAARQDPVEALRYE